jgi:hypothetical protein
VPRLGEAQRQTGQAAYRETLLEASRIASALADAELAARAALANNRGDSSVMGELDEQRLGAIERRSSSTTRRTRRRALACWDCGR